MTNLNTNTPTIIKRVEQAEVNEVSRLVASCGILPVSVIKRLIKKRGKTDKQIEIIVNQLIKRKLATLDETGTFLRVNKAYTSGNVNEGIVKSVWLMVDLIKNIEEYFIQTKLPHTLTFFNKTAADDGKNPFYDVYYIPYDNEQLSSYIINNSAEESEDVINAFIIIDSRDQLPKIKFTKKVNVVSFVIVDHDGKINYIN